MKKDWKRVFAFSNTAASTAWHLIVMNNQENSMFKFMKVLTVISICLGSLLGYVEGASAKQQPVTAIDIALEPDATMIQHATAANAQLLNIFPKGFALDATHHPHITILQRYIRTVKLKNVYAAVGKVLANEKAAGWQLKAFKYYYIPDKDLGLAGIVVEPTADLLKLQQKLIDAVAPFTLKTGTAAAYVTTPEAPDINQPTIDYVAAFVPNATGKNFNPHVTIGIASQDYLKEMLAEPFDLFTFSPAGAAVYQLGNFGTAQKKLKEWKLKL
jgi:2'-5' RNA ligase